MTHDPINPINFLQFDYMHRHYSSSLVNDLSVNSIFRATLKFRGKKRPSPPKGLTTRGT